MSLPEQLREAISATGQTTYRVAKESGVSFPIVYRFLKGERGITLDTAGKLADYLKLELRPIKAGAAKKRKGR